MVTMLRSWVSLSVLQMSPIWYAELGFSRAFYGPLAAVMIVAGAVGTLCGGGFADRIGQKRVVAGAIALTIPALLLYAAFPGPQGSFLAALFASSRTPRSRSLSSSRSGWCRVGSALPPA